MTTAIRSGAGARRTGRSPVDLFQEKLSIQPIPSGLPFFFFTVYMFSFYLHMASRIPGIGRIRPDLVLAAVLMALLVPYLKNKGELFRHPVTKVLNFFVIFVLVSLPFTQWPGSVLRFHLQDFIKAVLFLYFVVLTVDTPRRFRIFLTLFVVCQVIRVLEPLYLNLTDGYWGDKTWAGEGGPANRLSGAPSDVINPNGLGFVIATTVVFAYFLLWESKKFLHKLIYVAIVPPMLYALILTMSRGGFIALLVGGWLIFRQSQKKALLLIVAIVVAVGSWSIMSDVQRDRYLSLVSEESAQRGTAEGRFRGMQAEFELGFNRPLFGHGVGTTGEAKANFRGNSKAAHNLYAELMIETGIPGLLIFLVFMFRVHKTVRVNLEYLKQANVPADDADFYNRLGRGLTTVFWVYAVYSMNYFGVSQDYWYVMGGLCIAFGVLLQSLGRKEPPVPDSPRAATP
jgi:O-antigen ligase